MKIIDVSSTNNFFFVEYEYIDTSVAGKAVLTTSLACSRREPYVVYRFYNINTGEYLPDLAGMVNTFCEKELIKKMIAEAAKEYKEKLYENTKHPPI